MRRHAGLTLGELLVILAILLVVAAIAVPGLLSSQRASNERTASTELKTIASAEADFRANDRDWNHVNDFWTADVKGLYTMTSAATAGPDIHAPIRLITRELAAADADDAFYPAAGENLPLSKFAAPAPLAGYWHAALVRDLTLKGAPEGLYKVDTKGAPPMGAVHNLSKFGFASFPDTSRTGTYLFRVNENNTIFREELNQDLRKSSLPPKVLEWPDDAELKSYWSKID